MSHHRRFRLALYDMIGYYPSYFFVACWAVITPLICSGVFFFKLVTWENLVYQDYHYPWWAHAVGYFMAASSMACIPIYAAWLWFTTPGTWREVRSMDHLCCVNICYCVTYSVTTFIFRKWTQS